ncbi:hypothetical protein B0T14DRAFT_559070 [Immersiella caudata]|uniref:Uncharacterized protein n=1 Tax=Immersiella caudata TaxID=314043 RepID=A0AA40CA76_9PEZI|nr:hypothetical protein B0T14DRAFT_559070 [Immersiella caudata]
MDAIIKSAHGSIAYTRDSLLASSLPPSWALFTPARPRSLHGLYPLRDQWWNHAEQFLISSHVDGFDLSFANYSIEHTSAEPYISKQSFGAALVMRARNKELTKSLKTAQSIERHTNGFELTSHSTQHAN